MSGQGRAAVAVSVNDRLRSVARKMPGDPNLNNQMVYSRYVYERMMARLERTSAAGRWVLKGGALMLVLPRQSVHRMTLDMDWSSRQCADLSVTGCLQEILSVVPDPEDGMSYGLITEGNDAPRVIREDSAQPTVRAKLIAVLHCPRPNERRFVVNVTEAQMAFEPVIREWPASIRGFESPMVPSYPWELVLAEKLHAILTGSMANPRLRDYMDVIALSRSGVVESATAADFIVRVFEARGDSGRQYEEAPVGLTQAFADARQKDWSGTLARTGLAGEMHASLADAIAEVTAIAEPLLAATAPAPVLCR